MFEVIAIVAIVLAGATTVLTLNSGSSSLKFGLYNADVSQVDALKQLPDLKLYQVQTAYTAVARMRRSFRGAGQSSGHRPGAACR